MKAGADMYVSPRGLLVPRLAAAARMALGAFFPPIYNAMMSGMHKVMSFFFFKNIPNNWPTWADGLKICGVFGVFPIELSAHILTLCVPSP